MKWSPKYNWVGLSIHPLHNTNTTVKQHSLASFLFIVQTVVRPEIAKIQGPTPVLFQKKNVPRFTNVLQNVPKPYGIWHRILLIGEKNEISWSFLQKTPQKAKLARDHVHPPGHPWKLTAGTSKIHPNESRKVIFQTKRTKWMVYNGKPYYIKWMIWRYHYFWKTSMTFHSKSFTLMAPMGPVPPDWASNVLPFAGLVHSRSHAEKKVDPLGELETLPI